MTTMKSDHHTHRLASVGIEPVGRGEAGGLAREHGGQAAEHVGEGLGIDAQAAAVFHGGEMDQ